MNALFSLAIIKEMAKEAVPYDAETGIQAADPVKADGGTIRQPKKGLEVVECIRAQAARELQDFQNRPNTKWTWGADLEIKDLLEMAGAVYNNQQHWSHLGYDTELADGLVTGVDTPPPSLPGRHWKCEALSTNIIDVPPLTEDEIPAIFNYYPLAHRRLSDTDSELAKALQWQYSKQHRPGRQEIEYGAIIAQVKTPQLAIQLYIVLTPPMPQVAEKDMDAQNEDAKCSDRRSSSPNKWTRIWTMNV